MGFATTALRLVTGATMAGHGLQKLTSLPSLNGKGLEETGRSFEQMAFKPGRAFALATGVAETTGGTLMVLGLETPLACSLVSGVMTGAIARVHYKHGFWNAEHGFEYNLHILAATFAVAGAGGGSLALDSLRGKKHRGLGWAFLQLVVGAGAGAAAVAIAERQSGRQADEGGGAPHEGASQSGFEAPPGQGSHETPPAHGSDGGRVVDVAESGGAPDHAPSAGPWVASPAP
ncbi:MAG: DoxX family protein [Acidimicrobiales bacterium]